MRRAVVERDRWTCQLCRRRIARDPRDPDRALQIDHIVHVDIGGPTIVENLRATHAVCNRERSNRGQLALLAEAG
jgi:5-methylcytosine-specific restriction endonuclease McrA